VASVIKSLPEETLTLARASGLSSETIKTFKPSAARTSFAPSMLALGPVPIKSF